VRTSREWRRLERIGELVSAALPVRVRQGLIGWQAIDLWGEVVGRDAARRSAAVSFRDGRLIVEVVNSVWMQQLSASTRRYQRQLNEALRTPAVQEIVYRLNPRLGASGDAKAAPRGTAGTVPAAETVRHSPRWTSQEGPSRSTPGPDAGDRQDRNP